MSLNGKRLVKMKHSLLNRELHLGRLLYARGMSESKDLKWFLTS